MDRAAGFGLVDEGSNPSGPTILKDYISIIFMKEQKALIFSFYLKEDFKKALPVILSNVPRKITCADYHEEDMSIVFYFKSEEKRNEYVKKEENPFLYVFSNASVPLPFEPNGDFVFGYLPEKNFVVTGSKPKIRRF